MKIMNATKGLPIQKEDRSRLLDTVRELQKQGYTENFGSGHDHLTCGSGNIKVYPHDIVLENVYRFESTSDQDAESTLYAISYPALNIRGLYVEPSVDVLNLK